MPSKRTSKKAARDITAYVSGKGGTGKTTLCCGMAYLESRKGKRILIIDFDPQCNASWAMGANLSVLGLNESLRGSTPHNLQVINENVDILVGGRQISDLTRDLNPEHLHDWINETEWLSDYDLILLDCPPATDHIERLALFASNHACITMSPHPFALSGAQSVIKEVESRKARKRVCTRNVSLICMSLNKTRRRDKGMPSTLAKLLPGVPLHIVRQDTASLTDFTADQVPLPKTGRGINDLKKIQKEIYG